MGFRLTPRVDGFYELFGRAAAPLVEAANELTAILGAVDDRERKTIAKRIGDLENRSDEARQEIVRQAARAFVTPFDRGDLVRLAHALDRCADHMEAAADHIRLHSIDVIPARMGRQVDVLVRMSALTSEAMPRLRVLDELGDYVLEINRLENEADKNHRRLLAELITEHAADPVGFQRYVLVVEELEAAANAFETAANIIEDISVKEM